MRTQVRGSALVQHARAERGSVTAPRGSGEMCSARRETGLTVNYVSEVGNFACQPASAVKSCESCRRRSSSEGQQQRNGTSSSDCCEADE